MKKLLLLLTITGLALSQMACEGLESYLPGSSSASDRIEIYMHNASVEVVGYSGSEIKIEALGGYTAEDDTRSEGLNSLSSYGTDNTGHGVSLKEVDGAVIISKVTRKAVNYRIKVPAKAKIVLEETTWMGGERYELANLKNDVQVLTKTSSMYFKNIEGGIKARSTSGSAQLVFDKFSPNHYHDISLISGSIDVTLPTSAKTDLKLKTISGEVYTDFEFPKEKIGGEEFTHLGGGVGVDIRKSLNGGGTTMRLKTISSNIYLRKKK